MEFDHLSKFEQSFLAASILADGEITKCYKGSRRTNNSYREHFSPKQIGYREWKQSLLPEIFYLNSKKDTLKSKSLKLFNELFPLFYNLNGQKIIPEVILKKCTNPVFLAVLYMDDGSLTISKKVNERKKIIYLTPNINLYLQSFPENQLKLLQQHFLHTFNLKFSINSRNDGFGHILRITSTHESLILFNIIKKVTKNCPSMFYKTNWDYRLELEIEKFKKNYPEFEVRSSIPKPIYTKEEINKLIYYKNIGYKDADIARLLERSY